MDTYPEFMADVVDESTLPAPVEIGGEVLTPWDAFMSEPARIGNAEIGNVEIGANTEIGEALALRAVVEKARDNRQPAPTMRAVDVDSPQRDESDSWLMTDTFIGVAQATGSPDPFPLTSKLLQRFGAGAPPRIVRVDTEESYEQFRAANSPELAEFRRRLDDLAERFAAHEADPYAHEYPVEDLEDVTSLGEAVRGAEADKCIELSLPSSVDGKIARWIEDGYVCVSLKLPGCDGKVRICTAYEPVEKGVAEMSRHAAEAGVPAGEIVGSLPAMGVALGAANVIKDLAAAAPAILARPEAARSLPFEVRIEPKASPALCALATLALECRKGNPQACNEWQQLSSAGPMPVKQAMGEALALVQKAA